MDRPAPFESEVWDAADAANYDDEIADVSGPDVVGPIVDLLVELARGRPVLEFAVGTGRIALPLAGRGVDVTGIELSRPMLERLRAKPDADRLALVEGDMATARVEGTFGLVALVFNTIMNLRTQEAQVACFENAAAHLAPGGVFVVETLVPALRRLPPGQRFVPFDVSGGHIGIDEYDVVDQRLVSHHVIDHPTGTTRSRRTFRYVWPAELDLMARLAGMRLLHRWSDWRRSPFTADSTSHVSVWQQP